MKTLILYPDTHKLNHGIPERLNEQLSGIREAIVELLPDQAELNEATVETEWLCYRVRTANLTGSKAGSRAGSVRTTVLTGHFGNPIEFTDARGRTLEPEETEQRFASSDNCICIAESPARCAVDISLNKFLDTLPNSTIRISPAYPMSYMNNEIHLSQVSTKNNSEQQNTTSPVQQSPLAPTISLHTSRDVDNQYDYALHYEQFGPALGDFSYRHRNHALAILTGDHLSTLTAIREIKRWIQSNPKAINGLTLVLNNNPETDKLTLSVPINVIQADLCTPSEMFSLAAKSSIVFTAGNGLNVDISTLGIRTVVLQETSGIGQTIPNNRAALAECLRTDTLDRNCLDFKQDDQIPDESGDVKSTESVIPVFKLKKAEPLPSVSTKVISIKKKWKKFNESPRRFFEDSNSVVSLPFKMVRNRHGR